MGAAPCCCCDNKGKALPVPKLDTAAATDRVELPKDSARASSRSPKDSARASSRSPKDSARNSGRKGTAGNHERINSARRARQNAKRKTGEVSSSGSLASPFGISDGKNSKSSEDKLSARGSARIAENVEPLSRRQKMLGMTEAKDKDDDSTDSSSESDGSNPGGGPSMEEVTQQELHLVADELACGHFDNALLVACHGGLPNAFEECLSRGAHVDCHDANGLKAAYFATLSGSFETFQLILKYDKHHLHNASYFDSVVMPDHMTLLMMALRHGLTEIYEYLIIDLGCQLRLLGPRFGVSLFHLPGGKNAPLRMWYNLLPEVTHRKELPKKRHVRFIDEGKSKVAGCTIMKTVHLGRHPSTYTNEEFEDHRQRRILARNFVQAVFEKQKELRESAMRANAQQAFQDMVDAREEKRREVEEKAAKMLEAAMG